MTKYDEQLKSLKVPDKETDITAKIEDGQLIIRVPLDLLIWAQGNREDAFFVNDEEAMKKYLAEHVTEFGGDDEIGASEFELFLDRCFSDAFENSETWLNSWYELDERDSEDED